MQINSINTGIESKLPTHHNNLETKHIKPDGRNDSEHSPAKQQTEKGKYHTRPHLKLAIAHWVIYIIKCSI